MRFIIFFLVYHILFFVPFIQCIIHDAEQLIVPFIKGMIHYVEQYSLLINRVTVSSGSRTSAS